MDLQRIEQAELLQKALSGKDIRYKCDSAQFSFRHTSELPPEMNGMVGQERALQALEFGLAIDANGYNLYLAGPLGTGKTTCATQMVGQMAERKEKPGDWCYIYNFDDPDRPAAVRFEAGEAVRFRSAMRELVVEMAQELMRAFESEGYNDQRSSLIREAEEKGDRLWKLLENTARLQGISIQRTANGVMPVPLKSNGEPFTVKEFSMLNDLDKQLLMEKQRNVDELIEETLRQIISLEKETKRKNRELDEKTAKGAIKQLFEAVRERFLQPKVQLYLEQIERDVITHLDFFRRSGNEPEGKEEADLLLAKRSIDPRPHYEVHVVVENGGLTGAPVVMETNPTYYNLFGKTEYRGGFGGMVTDFTMIKAGSMHRANGGYLILQASDLLSHPMAWQGLIRALKTGEIRIESMGEEVATVPTSGLHPEPIPLQVKILLIGSAEMYQMIYQADESFRKFFKVKVDFDWEMPRNQANCELYARFVASYGNREKLLPFTREAVAEIVNFSIREAGHREKLSTRFHKVTELLVESSSLARQTSTLAVDAEHVRQSLRNRFFRSNQIEKKVQEMFQSGTIMIRTEGEQIGQINGLAVFNNGDYWFGEPHRITVRVFAGRNGVINVERESAMSGNIHDKGMLILSGYLAGEFAKTEPLSMSATIVFEQTYSRIDGDSASSAELYALLSALADLPIRQGIAVTGSVNQLGEIQAIGGVNEKIEGFFEICRMKGLTGEQGVVIPLANVPNLLLNDEVCQAVADGQFHIWPVKTVQEGIEILTGVRAGDAGAYGTVYGRVAQRLKEMGSGNRE